MDGIEDSLSGLPDGQPQKGIHTVKTISIPALSSDRYTVIPVDGDRMITGHITMHLAGSPAYARAICLPDGGALAVIDSVNTYEINSDFACHGLCIFLSNTSNSPLETQIVANTVYTEIYDVENQFDEVPPDESDT